MRWKQFGALLCAVVLGGCSGNTSGRDQVLSVAIQSNPSTLDPRLAVDAFGFKISDLIFDGLFTKDQQLNIVPLLAERFEQPEPTVYRVHLRRDAAFHDGTPLTADDVLYTVKSIRDARLASPFKSSFDQLQEVVAEDPYTVRFTLKRPFAPFLTALCVGIVPRSAEGRADFGRAPIGTGPYRFVRWVNDDVIELAANASYFHGSPHIGTLRLHVVKDDNVRVLKLIKGDVDLVQNGVPPLLMSKVRQEARLAQKTDVGTVMAYVGTNLKDRILKDVRVRRAIAMGIDRREIIAHRWQGLAEPANSVLSPINWAYDHALGQIPHDPEQAKRLLDEAGYPDPDGDGPKMRFTLSYKTSTVKERVDIARMIAHQLAKIGIGVNVQPYEWGTFFRDVRNGNFQLYSLSWVGVSDPDIFYDVFQSRQVPPAGLNRGHYRNPRLDQLVEEGRATIDPEQRRHIYAEVQRILLQDLPLIPLWYEKNVVLYRPDLRDVTLWPDASFRPLVRVSR